MTVRAHPALARVAMVAAFTLGHAAIAQPAGDVIQRTRLRQYTLGFNVVGSREPMPDRAAHRTFDIDEATVDVPLLRSSASHVAQAGVRIGVGFNDRPLPTRVFEIVSGAATDVIVARAVVPFAALHTEAGAAPNNGADALTIGVSAVVECADTLYDEKAALDIGWPSRAPLDVAPFAAPDAIVVSDHPVVRDLLDQWAPRGPQADPPARFAKRVAAEMVRAFRPSDDPFLATWPARDRWRGRLASPCDASSLPPGTPTQGWPAAPDTVAVLDDAAAVTFRGFDAAPASLEPSRGCFDPRILEPVETGRANDAVIASLYAALLRAGGLPARVVVGAAIDEADRALRPVVRRGNSRLEALTPFDPPLDQQVVYLHPVPRVWVEFFLFDDRTQRGQWVPVDLARQMRESSAPPPLDRPWRFFGNHDDLHRTVPFTTIPAVAEGDSPDWIPTVWTWTADRPLDFFVDAVATVRVHDRVLWPPVRNGEPNLLP